ncbi:MAG: UvrD-helicase domain-containing protein [Deltaproteobacteria bacterium]
MREFDVRTIDLSGKNLVEASAGTGKTYAIGILVLRLLLEKKIRIEEILMVTYTNAAVDELELRIRKFISDAILHVRDISICSEEHIKNIIEKSIRDNGHEQTLKLLNEATEFLDETSVFTIHGFCKKVLTDFAFENSMLLNTEIIDDQSRLIEDAVIEYWRRKINVTDPAILQKMLEKDLSVKNLTDLYIKHSNGAKLKIKNEINFHTLSQDFISKNEKINYSKDILNREVEKNWHIIITLSLGQLKHVKAAIENDSKDEFLEAFINSYRNNPKGDVIKKLDFLFSAADQLIINEAELSGFIDDVLACYCRNAVDFIDNEIELNKNRNRLISFYDMISILHKTLVISANQVLKKELNNKYKAVFIDEFQDTDKLQYEIFRQAFIDESDSILFFIGDPKQSIYSFRGADLDTYNLARESLKDSVYSMNTNFRSTEDLLNAINEFFDPEVVSAKGIKNNLNYSKVKFGNELLGKLLSSGQDDIAFDIVQSDLENRGKATQEIILEQMIAKLADIFQNGTILKNNTYRKILPSDIGILVRSKDHGKKIKEKLSQYRIPAVVVDDTRVVETSEAKELHYVLMAVLKPDNGSVSRALLSSFTAFTTDQIKLLNFDSVRDIFTKCRETWKNFGVYAAVSEFITRFDVRSKLIFSDNPAGNRIYTNLIQLAEILNEKEIYEGLTPEQVLDWLLRARQGDKSVPKYEQQLEDDENSVQIVTVHKSKGLAYNIVFLPLFNLKTFGKKQFCTVFKDSAGNKIVSVYNDEEETESSRLQEILENDRLLYVAITRAVYKCVIFHNTENDGILSEYIGRLPSELHSIIFTNPHVPDEKYRFRPETKKQIDYTPESFDSEIDISWKVTSYSGLSPLWMPEFKTSDKPLKQKNEYDDFIFNALQKGAQSGLLIHHILERINFSNLSACKNIVTRAIEDFGIKITERTLEFYLELFDNIFNTILVPAEFKLAEINFWKRISEMEFYFSIDRFHTSGLQKILPGNGVSYSELEGVMHGFIDLVFEHNYKYYILDWKTNHLGYEIADYSFDALTDEIKKNNYELQYLIYSIALIRYLRSVRSDFDYNRDFGGVIYLFVRGMRKGKNTGIYFNKPDESLLIELEKMI